MPRHLHREGGPALAYLQAEGGSPIVVFLHGFMSDMAGAKAEALALWCARHDRGFLRFDLSGHGASDGAIQAGTISQWRQDVLDVLDRLSDGPLVLVGSSMGGWLALLAAQARPERTAALVLIAPAPDFTRWGMAHTFTPDERESLARDGFVARPSAYGPDPYIIGRALIEDGEAHRLLEGPIALECPVRILHGQADADVPWHLSLELARQLATVDVQLLFIKDGDHRLSRPCDLAALESIMDQLAKNGSWR